MVRRLGKRVHGWYQAAYSLWRVRSSDVSVREALDAPEREFYLQLRPVLLGTGLVVYDIGAAAGVVSGCLAKLANVRAVHAFEPLESAFAELQKRVSRYPNVTCHNVAIGDSAGTQDIWVIEGSRDSSSLLEMRELHKEERPGVSYTSHLDRVRVVCLDAYVREHGLPEPHVVKIDVQGYEDRVLRGGRDTLRHARYCVLEMSMAQLYDGSPLFDDIYRQMRDLGFRFAGFGSQLVGHSGRPLQVDGIFENEHQPRSVH